MASSAYSTETRKRILEAACEAFSEGGYGGTSIRQIVAKSGTNIASVNYHFGSKEALYKEALERTLAKFASDFGSSLDDLEPGRVSLREIHAFAKRRIRAGYESKRLGPPRLLGWEIIAPKSDVKSLFMKGFEAKEDKLIDILTPLFGSEITAAQRSFAARWFFTATMPPPPVLMGLRKMLGPEPDKQSLERAISHLADAAIAGVRALTATPFASEEASPADPETD